MGIFNRRVKEGGGKSDVLNFPLFCPLEELMLVSHSVRIINHKSTVTLNGKQDGGLWANCISHLSNKLQLCP